MTWEPSPDRLEHAEMTALMREAGAADYSALWRWSVEDVERFWSTLWERFDIQADGDPATVLRGHAMPGAQWFPDVALSYPEHVFRDQDPDAIAVHFASETSPLAAWTWAQLGDQTARVRAGLRRLGVRRGDRVAAYLPNTPQTLAAFLATTSLGATWSCCSPDFGARTVIDRFAQIEPKVLLAASGYRYGGRDFDREDVLRELRERLPTLERVIGLDDWDAAFPATAEPLGFERVPFDHPLWIVYSSGTTGLPKAIVHGHGGILLEHMKTWRLHHDVRPGDRVLWFSTTGWIMWNFLAGGLLARASIVLYDGNPGHPDLGVLWDLAEQAQVTMFGAGAAYLHGCMKAGIRPAEGRDLSRLRALGSTGSPLAAEAYPWVREQLGAHVWLTSLSGGTDVACGFVGGCPIVPVRDGEIQCRMLGVAVEAWDDGGHPVIDEVGELVVTKPMPSMPVRFWDDPGDERYRDSYFSTFPGVWRHGDWIRITPRGSAVVYGRSDSTINRGGIRMGTSEIYAAVLAADGVADALVVDVPPADGTGDSTMTLFVVMAAGAGLTDGVAAELRRRIRSDCSPRHAPDEIIAVPDVPRTLTGKLLEVPVKRLLMGHAPEVVATRDALANPEAFDHIAALGKVRAAV
jgi:acetoacetyl-CoA synthetase